jgi:co-chaperonin GroES (HSP10)
MASSGISFGDDPNMQDLSVGDWVIYRQHAGQKIKFTDEDPDESEGPVAYLLIMNDTDVLAKLSETQAEQAYDWI